MKKLYFFNEEDFLHWNEDCGNLVTAIYDNAGEYLCDVLHKDYLHLLDLGFLESDSVINHLTDEQRKYFIETYGVDITIKQKEDEKGSEKRYTRKEMENAVHLSADLFMDLYEKWGDMRAVADFLIQKATELDERLEGKNEDEGNYDYVEELEKFEKEILKTL